MGCGVDHARDVKPDEGSDHDLLIRLDSRVSELRSRMVDRFDQLEKKLTEHDRTNERRHNDHERRIRAVERRLWALPSVATVLAVIGVVLGLWDQLGK